MEYRNPKYVHDGRIDCEINHPDFGWIAFTADANDPEALGSELHAQITAAGGIAAADPAPVFNVTTITKLQFTEWCETNNKLTDLMNLLSGDSVLMFKWNAASYLEVTNALVLAAAPSLGIVDVQATFNEIGQ